ncbi:MAG: ferrochelatase [Flavobacteriaceae bacterium]|nr:ferrochelatase [Flavobacteriaceae bacterium]
MKGALLVNLGSPDSTSPKDVKKYLNEFLMDERVVDLPYLFRAILVKGIILNTRPKQSAKAYKKIWWEEGSPLIVLSERLRDKVADRSTIPVGLAMRYGKPSLESGIRALVDNGVTEIFLLPLYPQFAMATTETIVVLANEIIAEKFPKVKLVDFPKFYRDSSYIEVLSQSIKTYLDKDKPDLLLFSYHGVPERHIRKSDPTKSHKMKVVGSCCENNPLAQETCYRFQCYETTRLVAEALDLKEGSYSTSFQSRLGVDPWLQPYTDQTISALPDKGVKRLSVVTPAFVSDCLETLEEIGMEAKEDFIENGGEWFSTIPCLNDRDDWAQVIANWINNWAKQN